METLKDVSIIALCITGVLWFAGSWNPNTQSTSAKSEHNVVQFYPDEISVDALNLENIGNVHHKNRMNAQNKQKSNENTLVKHFGDELPIIRAAAKRNDCHGELFTILLAIRKAENGRAGRELGIMHKKAINTDLDTQAGWAAATVVKNYKRWQDAGQPDDFITFLGNRYCPPHIHPLNKHWQTNVKTWIGYLK